MPDGKTHDRITLWLIPFVLGGSFLTTRNDRLTLLTAIAFGFSGLMFGPDLDIHSRQYQRWGWLRWLWLPYRKLLRHRSPLSHGFLFGTVLRLFYVGLWGVGLGVLVLGGVWLWQRGQVTFLPPTGSEVMTWGRHYQGELLASFIGLELGAMSHSLCDWGGSWLKKQQGKRRSPSKAISRRQRSGRRR